MDETLQIQLRFLERFGLEYQCVAVPISTTKKAFQYHPNSQKANRIIEKYVERYAHAPWKRMERQQIMKQIMTELAEPFQETLADGTTKKYRNGFKFVKWDTVIGGEWVPIEDAQYIVHRRMASRAANFNATTRNEIATSTARQNKQPAIKGILKGGTNGKVDPKQILVDKMNAMYVAAGVVVDSTLTSNCADEFFIAMETEGYERRLSSTKKVVVFRQYQQQRSSAVAGLSVSTTTAKQPWTPEQSTTDQGNRRVKRVGTPRAIPKKASAKSMVAQDSSFKSPPAKSKVAQESTPKKQAAKEDTRDEASTAGHAEVDERDGESTASGLNQPIARMRKFFGL